MPIFCLFPNQIHVQSNNKKKKFFLFTDEGPESSNEDSRPYSPSLSSSNEDILKPSARIGDRVDCDIEHQSIPQNDWLLRSDLRNSDSNRINSMDLAYLKDLDLSSTTESQAPSTLAANKEVESSTSFEYHGNNVIRSPFQREIQRLLDTSVSKIPIAINRTGVSEAKLIKNNNSTGHSYVNNGTNALCQSDAIHEFDSMQKSNNYMQVFLSGHSAIATVNGKHPVGLEAIKEIAKNTANTSDSSLM